jgi:NADH dehydrogenase FAD-containing subunit
MRLVVVGAGYAGTIAANRLAKRVRAAQITVINPRADFVELVRLHEQIAGTAAAATPLASMLREGVTTRVDTVDKIGDGQVTLGDGAGLDFDYLFLAGGSTVASLPGTVAVGTWEGAAVPGSRAACATAMPQGAHAADSPARMIQGRKPEAYSMGYTGQALSLGRHDGLLQAGRRNDTVCRLFTRGVQLHLLDLLDTDIGQTRWPQTCD